MKNKLTSRFLLLLILSFTCSFAQDLIIRKDGSKIYCRIAEVDSSTIFYFKDTQKDKFVIKRAEVKAYYQAKRNAERPEYLVRRKSC